jgi:serine/threonine-protein kinase HipA
MIANTDDHLKNHGFLYDESGKGWRLSPAYDLNPTPIDRKRRHLSTAIYEENDSASIEVAMEVIDHFRIKKAMATQIVSEVGDSVKVWREVALGFGISKKECDIMRSAFDS